MFTATTACVFARISLTMEGKNIAVIMSAAEMDTPIAQGTYNALKDAADSDTK